jgi:hypothetical protein
MEDNEEPTPQVDPAKALRASYPSNSKKSKDEVAIPKPKLDKLEGVSAVKQKAPLGPRLRAAFTGDDARSIGDYLLFDVALPAIKTTLFDIISGGANRALFGPNSGIRQNNNRGRINYNQISNSSGSRDEPRILSARDKATHNFDNIILGTRQEAELVLSTLIDTVERYDFAVISDLYDLVGVTGSFADDKWGWFDLRGSNIVPVRGGFILQLPTTQPIR